MRKLKIVPWAVVILFLVLVLFQNMKPFSILMALKLNLFIAGPYQSPEYPVGVWLLGAVLFGFLIAYFVGLLDRYRAHRAIKGLTAKLAAMSEFSETSQRLATSAPAPVAAPVSAQEEKETPVS